MPGTELFYLDDKGEKQDAALHQQILDNDEAEQALAVMAIERALARGVSPEEAQRLYGWQAKS